MQDLVNIHGVDVNQVNDSGDTASHLVVMPRAGLVVH